MTARRTLILAAVALAFLLLACGDWDINRTTDEFNGVLTRQIEGLPTSTPEAENETSGDVSP